MLEVSQESGKTVVKINFSSLDIIHNCLRKADYMLNRKFVKESESAALVFGSAIHKALEHWYSLPHERRDIINKELCEGMAFGHYLDIECEGATQSIQKFCLAMKNLQSIEENDKRSTENGVKILFSYFRHYKDDGYITVCDNQGPIVERSFEFKLYEDADLVIYYHGTIDTVLKHKDTGMVFVVDHKTTSSLGTQFFNRIKPNHQYTGYLLGAQKVLGINTKLFLVNGIQVAKTKCEFARQVTERDENDFKEFEAAIVFGVKTYLNALNTNQWPMYAPNPCSNYGACQFISVCSSPESIRETVLENLLNKN